MKIYLDDYRPIPEGWEGARNSSEFKALIEKAKSESIEIEEIALDNDLGENDGKGREIQGYDLIKWLAENYPEYILGETKLYSHSANTVQRNAIDNYIEFCRKHPEELMAHREKEYPFGEIEREPR